MSRIGKAPIKLPKEVQINVSDKNLVTVKGPLGELQQQVDSCISFNINEDVIDLERATEQKTHKAMHGLYRSLVANMVTGVLEGYKIEMELIGVGYRASSQGQQLELSLGFSHNVIFVLPVEVKVEAVTQRGKPPVIILNSIDKQLIGQVAAKIRKLRPPEPYKGKGIKFKGEIIRKKAGKTATA